jgi:hypothetical protein
LAALRTSALVIPVVYYTDDQERPPNSFPLMPKQPNNNLDKGEHRVMDCVDCHERLTHAFDLPVNAVDK